MTKPSFTHKTFALIMFLTFLSTLVSCMTDSEGLVSPVSPNRTDLTTEPLITPIKKPSSTASNRKTPTGKPERNEFFFEDQELTWLECNVPQDQFHNWSYGESCLGITLPKWSKEDKRMSGKHFQNKDSPHFDYRIQIGEDTYETNNSMNVVDLEGENYLIKFEYTLLKNGNIITRKTAPVIPFSPNRGLMNVGSRCVWEYADPQHSTVFYDDVSLVELFHLDAAYRPYGINGKLIFTAKENGKYHIVYDGKQLGPIFDEITVAYCCEPALYSIRYAQGQYWFWGVRENKHYIVAIYN